MYSHSDNLVVVQAGHEPTIVPAKRLGLRDMRGVVELPGTPLIAVMGAYRNVAIYDIAKDEATGCYATQNYMDTHLTYSA